MILSLHVRLMKTLALTPFSGSSGFSGFGLRLNVTGLCDPLNHLSAWFHGGVHIECMCFTRIWSFCTRQLFGAPSTYAMVVSSRMETLAPLREEFTHFPSCITAMICSQRGMLRCDSSTTVPGHWRSKARSGPHRPHPCKEFLIRQTCPCCIYVGRFV